MKRLAGVLFVVVLFLLAACEEISHNGTIVPAPTQQMGSIDGEFYLDPSIAGSVAKVQVAVYSSEASFRSRQPAIVVETNSRGQYFINEIACGQYWLDAWKDNDVNSAVTTGDYYLAHKDCNGVPCHLTVEQTPAMFGGQLEVVR